jgi:putative transcriptional regulator
VIKSLQNKIKEYRQKLGLTQEDLASKVYISRQTIISLENDRYNPSIFLAHKIAKIFGVTIEKVFIFEEDN